MTDDVKHPPQQPHRADWEPYVVGIGASAGGLGALRTFFSALPPEPGFACVIVMHLSPQHESHLVQLLQPYTRLPVKQVTRTVPLEPNNVYVIPPNANLDAIDTHLRLAPLEERRIERAPIDHFLRTLAANHDGRAIAVILTGSGSDGSLGVRRIKECAGLTIAQDPAEAEYDAMPRNAIATGMVDLVLPLKKMPEEIVRFCATRPRLSLRDEEDEADEVKEKKIEFDAIVAELEKRTDRDFKVYRRATMLRRIRRRMQLHHVETMEAYLALLRERTDEAPALCSDLLLTVADFFGDAAVFEHLETSVLPRLLAIKNTRNDKLRVWTVGCSTGEEAYSVAMLLLEQAPPPDVRPQLQVFASDLSAAMLERARNGLYPQEVAATVSPKRLDEFFSEEAGYYRVAQPVRDLVVFSEHNLFRDPPYAHVDLIICRNLLADLQPEMRSAVLETFHYALESHGMLVLSAQDPVDEPLLFEPDRQRPWLLRRVPGPFRPLASPAARSSNARHNAKQIAARATDPLQLAAIHHHMLDPYVPPSVLLDASDTVVHYSSEARRYLAVPGGQLTHNVFGLLREPLRSALRPLVDRARQDGRAQTSEPMTVVTIYGSRRVALHVIPPASDIADLLLIIFEELERSVHGDLEASPPSAAQTVAQLKGHLEGMERRVRNLVETSADDRNSIDNANTALQLSNEELRSLLEELESSKEELQVTNEELVTLDLENRHRLLELGRLSGDLRHLLESTGIATLFLDRELKIVRSTPQIAQIFNVRATDSGRPLTDVTHRLRYDELIDDAQRALVHETSVEREVPTKDGRWYLSRILPYRAPSNLIDGVVITLVDITDRRRAEEQLRAADRRKDEFLAVLAHELRNPLAPISAGIEVLKVAGNNPNRVAQMTAIMGRQTNQLVRLVDDLLDVSRVTGARLQLRTARVRVRDVVNDAVAAVRPLIDRSQHELTVEVSDEPMELDADGARLTQVLANLLNNAARYTPEGGKIEIKAERQSSRAIVTVADNGIGIAKATIGRVFEMFYQVDDPRLPRTAGLGIGLTLAKSLVEMHGGTLSAESQGLDRGSRFTVNLPLLDAERPAVNATAAAAHAPEVGGHRVLIVDDNTDAARTLGTLVETLGANEVLIATNGLEALRIAEAHRPDIVLLDLKMPGMDGYEVARLLRREPWGENVTLVALTGWAMDEHRRRSRDAGFDRHLTKPADLASIERVLAGGRGRVGEAPPSTPP